MAKDKIIMLLRGVPGAGKTTWLAAAGADPECIVSSDDVRIQLNGFEKDASGEERISQENPGRVWGEVRRRIIALCEREAPLIILDATNIKRNDMRGSARDAVKAGYRPVVVDFTDVPLAEAKRRNANRPGFRRVPEEVIDHMHALLAKQKVPGNFEVLTREEARKVIQGR